ncbi:MAG: N-acetyltransferase [Acidimicrobiaceae bacterium]|nr:N-acetyltransferase [Acidimicrobiaceae bacterium]
MTELVVKPVEASVLYELRRRVLRSNDPNQRVDDPRDADDTALHFGGFLSGRLVVSASFYPSEAPMSTELVSYQLRYMATDFDVQGSGYGAQVLAVASAELVARGAQQLWANARDTALGFYLATGWSTVEGSEHLSPYTQLPHTVILKKLPPAN